MLKLVHKFPKHHGLYSGKMAVWQETVRTERSSGFGQGKNNFQSYPKLHIIQVTLGTVMCLPVIFSGADASISLKINYINRTIIVKYYILFQAL